MFSIGVEAIGKEGAHFGVALEMSLGVLGEEFACGVEMSVFADAGKDIEHLAARGTGILHAVGGDHRQAKMFRQIAELLVTPIFAAQEMALDFDVDVFAAERVDQKLRPIRRILGNARASRAVSAPSPKLSSATQVRFGEGADRRTRGACAPQKSNQPFREFRQFVPLKRALAFRAPEMPLREQAAQIGVAGRSFTSTGKTRAIFHGQFGADNRPDIFLAGGDRKSLGAIDAVAIEQRHRRHFQLGGGLG